MTPMSPPFCRVLTYPCSKEAELHILFNNA